MSEIFQPTVESLSVSPRTAGEMLGYGKTRIWALMKSGELKSYADGGRARRILTSSIRDYVARKVEETRPPKRRGPGRPKKNTAT